MQRKLKFLCFVLCLKVVSCKVGPSINTIKNQKIDNKNNNFMQQNSNYASDGTFKGNFNAS